MRNIIFAKLEIGKGFPEELFRFAMEHILEGIKVNRETINSLRYPEDMVPISDTGLQNIIGSDFRMVKPKRIYFHF